MSTISLTTLLLSGLAVYQIVQVLHHSELSIPLRRWALKRIRGEGLLVDQDFLGFVAKAIACPFCLSHWVAGAASLVIVLSGLLPSPAARGGAFSFWATLPFVWLILTFASAALANLINNILARCDADLTPRAWVEDETNNHKVIDDDDDDPG